MDRSFSASLLVGLLPLVVACNGVLANDAPTDASPPDSLGGSPPDASPPDAFAPDSRPPSGPSDDAGDDDATSPPDTTAPSPDAPPPDATPPCATLVCSGACVDPTTDPQNCGGCDRVCPTGCSSGGCVPTDLGSGGLNLVATATGLFWTGGPGFQGYIVGTDLNDTVETQLVSNLWGLTGIAADTNNVYWFQNYINNDTNSFAIGEKPLDGGAPITLLSPTDRVVVLGLNATHIFFDLGYTSIWRVPIDGSSPATAVVTGQSYVETFAVDAANVYWSNGTQILKTTVDGATTTVLVDQSAEEVLSIAVDATNVYFTAEQEGDAGGQLNGIYSVPIAGGALTKLRDPGWPLIVDGANLYFGWANALYRMPTSGGAVVSLLQQQNIYFQFFAVGPTEVYVPASGTGGAISIVEVPK